MNTATKSNKAKPERIYQGIGVICGRVKVDQAGKYFIDIEGETFKFKPTKAVRNRLIPHLEKHADALVYLRVYPAYNLNSHKLWFNAIAFYTSKPESTQVNQFLLAGVWQYIPQLTNQPVMSIYRNTLRSGEKIEYVRTNHIPVQGFTEQGYRYELKNSPENPHKRTFYQLLVSLNPQQRTFEYLVTLDSTEDIPPYIKQKYQPQKPSQSELGERKKGWEKGGVVSVYNTITKSYPTLN
ncbi:MAG: hypothetical protein AAF298_11605 [Cyanobacteria bacterium P01_A01_bin.40]